MNKTLKYTYLLLIYLFLYAPIAVLIIHSFNNSTFLDAWQGFTWHWYKDLFHDKTILLITKNSLILAVLSATIATIISALGATALFRYKFFGKKLLHGLIFVLIVVPDLVLGISLLVAYAILKMPLGFWTLLLAHITFCIPFVMVTVLGRLSDMDKNIFAAARDLGASDRLIFFKIILPLIAPALVAGWLLSFTLSIDDVIISFFVSGPNFQILPLYIYSQVHVGVTPEINALCTMILLFTGMLVLSSQILVRKK